MVGVNTPVVWACMWQANQEFPISIEVQLLGGNGKDKRTTANLCSPKTNVVLKGKLFTDHCISSGSETFHGDQWVRVEVLVLGDSVIKHFINKKTILEYERPQVGNGNVSDYDPAAKKDGMLLSEGYIAWVSNKAHSPIINYFCKRFTFGKQGLIKVCNKLLKQLYAVVKSYTLYQPNYCSAKL